MAIYLGVNIDHIATLRQVRRAVAPDILQAAEAAVAGGADSITVHLREDRRHIQPADVERLQVNISVPLNLEMAGTESILQFARKIRPKYACIVPEKREELTTEGGLDIIVHRKQIEAVCQALAEKDILVSLFVDAERKIIDAAKTCGAPMIEIHTGHYANAKTPVERQKILQQITEMAAYAHDLGLEVHAGHGLDYHNVKDIAKIPQIKELNIGHSIVARSVMVGLEQAVREMKACL